MKNHRQIALEILLEVEENQAYSNITINKYIRKYQISEGGFIREIVYGVIENKLYLDYILSSLIQTGFRKLKSPILMILRIGLYQLIFLSGTPDYAVVNESVKLTRKYSHRHSGFVNAVLRNYMRKKNEIRLPDREKYLVKYLSLKYSYEPWLIQEWLKIYSESFTEDLLKAGNETPDVSIRVNTLKAEVSDIADRLLQRGMKVEKGKYIKEALRVKGGGLIYNNELYDKGLYQIQDESSMLAVKALNPLPGDHIVDVCAAPGGKTIYAAELMKDKGHILARDIHEHKLDLLNERAKSHGVHIIETQVYDALIYDSNLKEKADKVLADVPCSGYGVIRRKPEIKYKKEETKELVDIQYRILKNAGEYVKKGGTLIYSTCTISKYENNEVIKKFLQDQNEFKVVPLDIDEFKKFEKDNEMVQLFPNQHETDGFFICKMLKNE